MESQKNISVNWELQIENAIGVVRGTFSLSKAHNLFLVYNQVDNYFFHTKGKLAKISAGKINVILETKKYLSNPVVDKNEDVYVCDHGNHNWSNENSTLSRINSAGTVVWEYPLDGASTGKLHRKYIFYKMCYCQAN